jgi:hypothetical protein
MPREAWHFGKPGPLGPRSLGSSTCTSSSRGGGGAEGLERAVTPS